MARPARSTRPADAPLEGRTLDDLLALSPDQLGALYAGASVPRLDQVEGDLRGRMLAWPSMSRGPVAGLLRRWAASSRFPWRGKSFTAGDERGEGINRVILDRFRLYRFETFVGRSRAGDFDAVQLDYDRPGNPFFIRPIRDEIRELSPGLYLGQAWLEIGARPPALVLYFGLTAGG
jgi:hypothetical protein